jgi:large conductance mechanosensitive channel
MAFWEDFKAFALKGNVVDLAVAVVVGGAFGKIVSALVSDIIMPIVGALMPSTEWRTWQATPLHLKVGDFLGAVVDFFIVAIVLFLVVVKVGGRFRKPAEVTTRDCPECLEKIPLAARRCKFCGEALQKAA